MRRHFTARKAVTNLGRAEESVHQLLVNVMPQQAQRGVIVLRYKRRKFEPGDIQQENMHGWAELFLNDLLAKLEFADKGLGIDGPFESAERVLNILFQAAVDAACHDHQVVAVTEAVSADDPHRVSFALDSGDYPLNEVCAFLAGEFLQVAVKTPGVRGLGIARTVAAKDRRDSTLLQRRLDFHIADIHVQRVGLDAALYNVIRKRNTFGSQSLHQRFGHYSATMIAAGRPAHAELPGLVQVDLDIERDRRCHFTKKITEH